MPLLNFKNTSAEVVANISRDIIDELSAAVQCPSEWFTFTHTQSTTFQNGKSTSGVIVEVQWFARPQEIKEAVANIVCQALVNNYSVPEVTMIFRSMDQVDYFEA